ncbi:hypothetical protein [Tenacibaculum mesophilum]|nr:hypothetical protein [Tenacibaculum mesophilum]
MAVEIKAPENTTFKGLLAPVFI